MIARRLVVALVIAVCISGLFTYWVSRKVNRAHEQAPRVQQRFVVASRSIRSGESLEPTNLSLTDSPSPTLIPGSFAKIEEVSGRAALYPLAQGEPVLERYLALAGAGSGLTVKIPPGMRAISLRSDEVMGVSGFLLPGTYVDILSTYHTSLNPEPVTATVLQDVQVIAAGQQIQADPEGKPSTVNVVTVLLKAQDAEKAVMASSQGSIHFVLRNGNDRSQIAGEPISALQLAQSGPPRKATPAGVAKLAPARAKDHEVETFMGDKHTVTSFN